MDAILNRETVTGVTISDAQDLFGKAKNASALPTATIWKNGVATATAITVTKPEATTGIYICTFTLSSPDWSVYDTYSILFTALQNDGETDHPAQMFVREGIVKPEHHFSLYVEPTEGTVKAEVEGMATSSALEALEDKVDALSVKVDNIIAGTSVLRSDNRDGDAIATQASVGVVDGKVDALDTKLDNINIDLTPVTDDLEILRKLRINKVILHPAKQGWIQVLDDDNVTPYAELYLPGNGTRTTTLLQDDAT